VLVALPISVDKHHYAARSLAGRVFGAVLFWLIGALVIWLALAAFARLVRRYGDTQDILGASAGWMLSLTLSAAAVVLLQLTRHHWRYPQLGPRISSSVAIWLLAAFAIRLALLAIASTRGRSEGHPSSARDASSQEDSQAP
jgi:chromate transport protein ChrA